MMNSQKNAMECAVSMASESEFLKAMDAKKQDNEPLASEELAELLRRTEQLADRLAPERTATLRALCDGWQRLVQAGYALALDYVPCSGDGVGELLTTAPEGADWRAENLRLTDVYKRQRRGRSPSRASTAAPLKTVWSRTASSVSAM